MLRLVASLALAAWLASPAQAQPAPVAVTQAWSRATIPGGQTGAVYLTVTASAPDRLTGASTPVAGQAELHRSTMVDGVIEMRPVADLPVAPGAPIHLEPGGYHLMLVHLKQPLHPGDRFPVTLTFEHAGEVTAQAVVGSVGATTPPEDAAGE